MPTRRPSPLQTWRTFLTTHVRDLVSIDFFTVPTAHLRVLFVLVVLAHHRRRVVHVNVTEHPTTALDRPADRGGVPGRHRAVLPPPRSRHELRSRVSAPSEGQGHPGGTDRAPESVAEPLRGAAHRLGPARVSRPCPRAQREASPPSLDPLLRLLSHGVRAHLSLEKDPPDARPIERPAMGTVVSSPEVGVCIIATSGERPESAPTSRHARDLPAVRPLAIPVHTPPHPTSFRSGPDS